MTILGCQARRGDLGQNPTLRGRRLAMELQRRREATGMSREEVARQLEWSTSTLFRIETGRSRPQPGNVRMLLELYGVTGPERDGLIQLTREARQPGWWHSFRDVLPNPYEVYIGLEAGAASIRNFEPIVVPGLLQTADYAREIFRNGPIELDPDEVERLLEVRLARQQILAREDRPRLWAVIDEAVIHRVVGGPEVMRGQLRHLVESAQHKSSYSGQSGNCVEVAHNLPGLVAIRGSKSPEGPNLLVSPGTWRAFLLTLRS